MWNDSTSLRPWFAFVLALPLGMGAGAAAMKAGDGTPYSQADVNEAGATALHTSQAAVEEFRQVSVKSTSALQVARDDLSRVREKNALLEKDREKADRLREENASLKQDLDDARTDVDRLRHERQQALTKLRVAEQLASEKATSSVAVSDPSEASVSNGATSSRLTVTGVLDSGWILGAHLKPWPSDCSGPLESYQVRVNTGDHATVAIGELTGSRMVKRSEKRGILTLQCELTYRATLDGPLDDVYEFQAVEVSDPDTSLRTAVVPRAELLDGQAPELHITFCPSC